MAAPSLKSILPQLALKFDVTPATLYERQRVLVSAGMMTARPGRGPGSGVPADVKSVSVLLMSMLATSSLSEVARDTYRLANLKCREGRCPLTGKRKFGDVFTAIIASEDLLSRLVGCTLLKSTTGVGADIGLADRPVSEFDGAIEKKHRIEVVFGDVDETVISRESVLIQQLMMTPTKALEGITLGGQK